MVLGFHQEVDASAGACQVGQCQVAASLFRRHDLVTGARHEHAVSVGIHVGHAADFVRDAERRQQGDGLATMIRLIAMSDLFRTE